MMIKLFDKYIDAIMDEKYTVVKLETSGNLQAILVEGDICYSLKEFLRPSGIVETVYLKIV